ncbi:MAG: phosphotransferase [Chloroflexota bacterium]|nr:phosphotransferase [Chloroflexota bacterium]
MNVATRSRPYFAAPEFPADLKLPDLPKLFDSHWVWQICQARLPAQQGDPQRIRIHHFIHNIGKSATVSYEISWPEDRYLPSEYFVATIGRNGTLAAHRYPQDPRLPGLEMAARPDSALRLVNEHVLQVPARRARVHLIRYRPRYRAVLRHLIGKVRLYARVVRPADFASFLAAYERSQQSGFAVPGLAGHWAEGGVMWLTEVRGRNLRSLVRKGKPPPPDRLLNSLEQLWSVSLDNRSIRPFDLKRAYRRALRSFRHNSRDCKETERTLSCISERLNPFIESWQPTCMAHNDFYDDQMLQLRDGRIALVDFEEIAPGDPMLDIGNFLAHLRWSARFSRAPRADNCRQYHDMLRAAALARFRWNADSLALREAVCLFRVCTNAIRHPKEDWRERLSSGLLLVADCLG